MSRIFLSHSSIDELEAVALKEWLAANGRGTTHMRKEVIERTGE